MKKKLTETSIKQRKLFIMANHKRENHCRHVQIDTMQNKRVRNCVLSNIESVRFSIAYFMTGSYTRMEGYT